MAAVGFAQCGCNRTIEPWEEARCVAEPEAPGVVLRSNPGCSLMSRLNAEFRGAIRLEADGPRAGDWWPKHNQPGTSHRIRVLRQTSLDDFGTYVQQRFDVELIGEALIPDAYVYLDWMGPRALVDLSGGVFIYSWRAKSIMGYMNLESQTPEAHSLRNEAGELLLADGMLAFEEQLSSFLPEFEWAPVDLGCTYEPFNQGTTSEELRRVMAVTLKVKGGELELQPNDVGQWHINCKHLFVSSFAMKTRPLVAGGETPIPSRIIFAAWREGMLKGSPDGAGAR